MINFFPCRPHRVFCQENHLRQINFIHKSHRFFSRPACGRIKIIKYNLVNYYYITLSSPAKVCSWETHLSLVATIFSCSAVIPTKTKLTTQGQNYKAGPVQLHSNVSIYISKLPATAEERSESSERLLVGVVSCCAVAVATCIIVSGGLLYHLATIILSLARNLSTLYLFECNHGWSRWSVEVQCSKLPICWIPPSQWHLLCSTSLWG